LVEKIESAGVEKVRIRSVLTCQTRRGICVLCYGRDLSRGRMVSIGETVGVIAAQSIGEPGTQLTMRTFHVGGTATRRAEQSSLESRNTGKIKYFNLHAVKNKDGRLTVTNRNAEVAIIDATGREKERYSLTYGSQLIKNDGDDIKAGSMIAEWDPYTLPILTETGGKVRYNDLVEGATMQDQVDPVTGLSSKVIIESRDPSARPSIGLLDEKGTPYKFKSGSDANYMLPVGAILMVQDGEKFLRAVLSRESLGKQPKQRILQVVYHVLLNFSKLANQKRSLSFPKSTVSYLSVRTPKVNVKWSSLLKWVNHANT
jgi:DNA-directed RNA polymerase subunit beta'